MAPCDLAAPASHSASPPLLSRRQLLQAAAGLGALVVLGTLPGEAEGATLSALTAAQLTGAMAALPRSGTVKLPGGGAARATDLRAAAAAFAVADPATPDPATNPTAALGVLCALAAWAERNGTLDLSGILPRAPVRPLRLALPRLPSAVSSVTYGSAVPPALVVRPKGSLILVGALSGHRVLAALEDPARQVAGHPRLELVVLRAADVTSLLAVLRAKLDASGTVVLLASGSKVPLRPLASSLATRLLHAAGVRFVDAQPLQPPAATSPGLTTEPIVPAPPTGVVPSYAHVSQAADGRVLALDAGGTAVGRARYRSWRPDWAWTNTPYQVEGYTIRELADALGLTFASFAPGSEVTDGDPSWELVANTLIASDGLDIADRYGLFGQWSRDDWARVVAAWSDVSAALDAHVVPSGFAPDWSDAELELAFARSHGVRYIQGLNLLWGSNGVLPAIYNGGFSADDLRKILEFAVKVRVIKYAGRIQEWIGVSEAAADLLWGTPEQRFWYDQLGTEIIDQVFTWAHEADPTARLAFCEDRILDQDSPQVFGATSDKFMGFLEHFKSAGVPVDKAVLEDNLWIYAPPSKAGMVATLQQIQSLGFAIGAAETTVSISDHDPIWAQRPRTVTSVPDPVQAQADLYRDLVDAYLEVGAEFGIWAPSDRYSWFAVPPQNEPETRALLLDANLQPKSAYFAVRDVLKAKAGLA